MRLPTCKRCNKAIKPEQPAFHRQGVPAFHRKCFSDGPPLRGGRWSELIAAVREQAEGSGGLASRLTFPHEAIPKRGTKPDLDAIERRWVPGAKRRRAKK